MIRMISTVGCVALGLLLGGCQQKTVERSYQAVIGEARHIDLRLGLVEMNWTNDKNGEQRTFSGRFTRDTEILINGVAASLSDLHVGDQGVVIAYHPAITESLPAAEWLVVRVMVQREESFILQQPLLRNLELVPATAPDATPL
ncbi:MAG: hypothetical protein HJJLKODD_00741 [Phycisphaerae bacterium]|nr:hypothetical protein [Phycisphaerae bacterium]